MSRTPGDIIKFFRGGYKHYAIYIGTNDEGSESVIHWWTEDNAVEPRIKITPFQNLADSLENEVEEHQNNGNLVAQRAIAFNQCVDARLAEGMNYKSLFDNNEQFINWCYNGLGRIDIDIQEIRNVRDPWRFVHGSVTNPLGPPDISSSNDKVLQNLAPGEMIRFCHQDYEHWGFYLGEQGGIHNVIHWWDRDSVDIPIIVIDDFKRVAGHCKAEIDSYKISTDVNGEQAVHLARQFREKAGLSPDKMFKSSKQFVFWCHFGLGLSNLQEIPVMAAVEDVRRFVNGLMATSDPDDITINHNNMIEQQLYPGDVITLSKDSRQYFAVCIERSDGQRQCRVMRWLENGFPSIVVELFRTAALNKKAQLWKQRDTLNGVINWNEMVNRANALKARVQNNAEDDYSGLFSTSKHFALWVFKKYGPTDANVTVQEIRECPDIWQHVYEFEKSNESNENKVRIRRQNKRVLNAFKEGDLVMFHRYRYRMIHYKHYAVYIGECEESGALSVIHWYPDPTNHSQTNPKASLRNDAFWKVVRHEVVENGNDVMKEHGDIDEKEVVARAKRAQDDFEKKERERNRKYNLLSYNCEHFANECRYGHATSSQVDRIKFWPISER